MAYTNPNKEKQYIIETDVDESDNVQMKKPMKSAVMRNGQLPDNYELEEDPVPMTQSVQDEIQEAAQEEGLVSESLGGDNPTHQEVIDALKTSEMPEGAQKNKEEYEEEKTKTFRKITATRDLLTRRTQRSIPITIKTVMDVDLPNGEIGHELVELEFHIKRLTESEINHVINHKLINKADADMTDEEYAQASKFKSKFLARTILDDELDEDFWRNECDVGLMNTTFNKVTDVLNRIDDTSLFQ